MREGGTVRNLARLHEISLVFVRHGLGDFLRRIGVATILERAGEVLLWNESSRSEQLEPQQRLRLAFEELGPTFIKLGQMLSMRDDLLPPKWTAELARLQSSATPTPFDQILKVIEQSLGAPHTEFFVDLDPQPAGAASIAQVHRARLPDGRNVVLKVRRPGIERKVEADLRLLAQIARLVENNMADARRYQPVRIVEEFRASMMRELDLAIEAHNIERIGRNFRDEPYVSIPRVYPQWTSESMNVQEYIDGISAEDPARVEASGLDLKLLAQRGVDNVLKMILEDGFFQADPHPGNVLYLPGNRIAMIDFGMVGRMSGARRNQIIDLLAGITRRDSEPMVEVLLDWAGEEPVDEDRLTADVDELVSDFADLPVKDMRMVELLGRVTTLMRTHGIVLPSDLTLMFKALMTLEGSGRRYDPDFVLADRLKPFVERALGARYAPAEMGRRGGANLLHMIDQLQGIPRDVGRLLKDARRGRLRLDLDLKRLDKFVGVLDRTINRMTIGIMTASVVIGSSMVMTVTSGPELWGIPIFTILGSLGFLMAFVNSVWVVLSIWRSRSG